MFGNKLLRRAAIAATAALALGGVAACGDNTEGNGSGTPGDVKKSITIGYMAWDEAIAASYLWQNILESQGYEVKLTNVEAGVVYSGLASGDIDLFLDGWLPQTHASYMKQYGDDIEPFDKASIDDAILRDRLASLKAELEVMRFTALRSLSNVTGGEDSSVIPGPGAPRRRRPGRSLPRARHRCPGLRCGIGRRPPPPRRRGHPRSS